MSCNTKTSLAAVIDAVNAQLNNNYVDRDDPRIDQGVFTEPTIRGGLMLDEAAKLDFCGYVTECGQREPFGKQWVDRPLYPDNMLVSYEDEGEIKSRWQDMDDVIDVTLRQDLANPDMGATMLARGVVAVDSIADLLALPEGQRKEGLRYLVKGYHAGSDVGGGEFYWDTTSTQEDNGGTVFAVNGVAEGRWIRVTSGSLNVTWFGASPGQINNTPAIQAALDYSESAGIGHVYIPGGEYMVDAHSKTEYGQRWRYGLDVRQNTLVEMSEDATLRVIPNDKESYSVFRIDGVNNVSIFGGNITGDKLEHTYIGSMEWGYGISVLRGSKNITISGVTIKDCMGDGFYIRSYEYSDNNITINDCTIFDCRRHEMTIVSGDKVLVSNCRFYKTSSVKDGVINSTYGGLNVDIEPSNSNEYPPSNITFDNCAFDCPTNACLRSDTKGKAVKGLTISRCLFTSNVAPLIEAISVNNGQDVVVEGNRVLGNGKGHSIEMRSVKGVVITGNYSDSSYGIQLIKHPDYTAEGVRWVTEFCEDFVVSDNISKSSFLGVSFTALNGSIHGNVFNHAWASQPAITISGACRDITVSSNTVTNSLGLCFNIGAGAERVSVTGNQFKSRGSSCGQIYSSKDIYVSSNTFNADQYHIRVRDNQNKLTLSGNVFIVSDGGTAPYGVLHSNGSGDVFVIGNNFSQMSSSEYNLSSDVSTNLVRGGNILADGSYEGAAMAPSGGDPAQ